MHRKYLEMQQPKVVCLVHEKKNINSNLVDFYLQVMLVILTNMLSYHYRIDTEWPWANEIM